MTGYDIIVSDADLLTTIPEKTIDNRRSSSLVLIGQGVPSNWQTIDQNLVWLLENFSKDSPPPKPLIGQKWHDSYRDQMNVYTGQAWQQIPTADATFEAMFDMSDAATGIDLTVQQSSPIFTATDPTKIYCPTSLMLVPRGGITATAPATINVSVLSAGDAVSSRSIEVVTDRVIRLSTDATCRMVSASMVAPDAPYGRGRYGDGPYGLVEGSLSTVFLNITTPAVGGDLSYDAFLYGTILPAPPQSLYGIGGYGLGPYGRGAE